jgi:hypothetical protein
MSGVCIRRLRSCACWGSVTVALYILRRVGVNIVYCLHLHAWEVSMYIYSVNSLSILRQHVVNNYGLNAGRSNEVCSASGRLNHCLCMSPRSDSVGRSESLVSVTVSA